MQQQQEPSTDKGHLRRIGALWRKATQQAAQDLEAQAAVEGLLPPLPRGPGSALGERSQSAFGTERSCRLFLRGADSIKICFGLPRHAQVRLKRIPTGALHCAV